MQQESFAEKVIYRLIKKHIAGPTMSLAIKKAKQINDKGLPVSITFLSAAPSDRPKVNYVTNTYLQLAREIARIGVRGSIDVPLEQIGMGISEEVAAESTGKIIEACRRYGIFTWIGIGDPSKELKVVRKLGFQKGVGLYFNSIKNLNLYAEKADSAYPIKVVCRMDGEKKEEEKESTVAEINKVLRKFHKLILFSPSENVTSKLLGDAKNRKALIFEFQLGYSDKKLNKIVKRGARVSISMPFGRDWVGYAINNVPEGYMRLLANTLLKEEKEEKEEARKEKEG